MSEVAFGAIVLTVTFAVSLTVGLLVAAAASALQWLADLIMKW